MRRWKSSLLLLFLAVISLAQNSSRQAVIERVGGKLACLCGSCNNTVANCPMLECHYSKPAKEQIAAMSAAGKSDAEIIDYFVKREGLRALSEPPAEGFNIMGRLMPFVALGLGLWLVWAFMQRFRRKPAPAADAGLDPESLAKYEKRIEKDLANLD